MPRHWKMLGLASLLALALALVAPPARAGGTDGVNPEQDKLKTLQDAIAKMDAGLKKAFDGIREDIDGLRKEVKSLKAAYADASLKAADASMRATELEKQVAVLRAEMDAIRKRVPSDGGTISLYPPGEKKAVLDEILRRLTAIEQRLSQMQTTVQRPAFPQANGGMGRVLLVNRHAEDVLFVVNGRTYRVAPGASASLDGVAAGTFTYEVISPTWGLVRPTQTRTLAAQETFTITAQ